MKIGVTGGTGFIGQYLLKEYSDQYQFIVATSRDNADASLYAHFNVTYVKISYDQSGFEKAFSGCDAVVHLGAKRSSKNRQEKIDDFFCNLETAEALFDACRTLDIKNIVNISSTAVYDSTLQKPYQEKYAAAPLSNYGVIKLAVEGLAHLYNSKFGMHIKSLRLAQVLGVGERAGYILSVFQERCLKKEKLYVYGRGTSGREYVYVKDVVYAIICALKAENEADVYNVGTGILTTNLELAVAFCKIFDNEAGYERLLDKPDVVEDYVMDVSYAWEKIGYRAKYTLESALVDMHKILINEG